MMHQTGASENRTQFFVSYASEERSKALRLCNALRKAGQAVWHDVSDLHPGDILVQRITEGVEASDVVVLCLSPTAIDSPWVKLELSLAEERKMRIIPVFLRTCTNIPQQLQDRRCLDMRTWPALAEGVSEILAMLSTNDGEGPPDGLTEAEWMGVWRAQSYPLSSGELVYSSYLRRRGHVRGKDELDRLLRSFSALNDGDVQAASERIHDFLARYPEEMFERYKAWIRFARTQGLAVAEDEHLFAIHMTPLKPNPLTERYWRLRKKGYNSDLAWTWALTEEAGGALDD